MAMTKTELAERVALGEGLTTEFKQSLPRDLGRSLCAFANASGGTIFLGVADDGSLVGVSDHATLKSQIQDIAHKASPPIVVDITRVGKILCVLVPCQNRKPFSYGGKFYLREGANSQQMSRDEIKEFFYKEGLIRFDETPCDDYQIKKELTPKIWRRFAQRADLPTHINRHRALANLSLVKDHKMTRAGAWLLCDDITKFTRAAQVMCAAYSGNNKVHIVDSENLTSDLYTIYEGGMKFMHRNLRTALLPHAQGRDERLEIPATALREALVNALAHRDYRQTAHVHIDIYQNRLEIVSPGGLPGGMSKKDFRQHKSVPRNPLLFDLFYRLRLVEKIGSGVARIMSECQALTITKPKIRISENWVTLIFPRGLAASAGAPKSPPSRPQVTPKSPPSRPQVAPKSPLSRPQVAPKSPPSRPQVAPKSPPSRPQVAPKSTMTLEQQTIVRRLRGACAAQQLRQWSGRTDKKAFRQAVLLPLVHGGWLEMTIPHKPTSSKQTYRLTATAQKWLRDHPQTGR